MRINGTDLVVEAFGPEDAPPMIVHHGAPGLGSRAEPRRSFGAFAQRLRIIVFDARGSGDSGDDGPFTHEQWVADLDAVRAHFGYEQIVLAGGSYGGYIALEYTVAHPERVRALILRDTAADTAHQQLSVQRARDTDRTVIPEWVIERIGTGHFESDAQLREYWGAILPLYDHHYDPAATQARLDATQFHYRTHNAAFGQNMPRYDLKPQLPGIHCPTLVTVGRHDWRTPVEASQTIAELIPDARLVVFEKSGHSPQLEEPELFQSVVWDFLTDAAILPSR